eukprot:g35716.t1
MGEAIGHVLLSDGGSDTEAEEEEDGMNDMNQDLMSLIWNEDLRVQEVRRLLQSTHPVRVNVVQMPEMSDHEYIEEKENRWWTDSGESGAISFLVEGTDPRLGVVGHRSSAGGRGAPILGWV